MAKLRTHYDNLKVARNAPDIVIKAAHKALIQQHHPDKAKDKDSAERITRILNDAKEVLLDPVKRKQHDQWIKEQEHRHKHHGHHAANEPESARQHPPPPGPPVSEELIGHYRAFSNGLAQDTQSRLMWCRFAMGQRWHGGQVEGEAALYAWQAAQEAVALFNKQGGYAGHADWRLPSVNELKTLINPQEGHRSYINAQVFPNNPRWLWTASPYAGYGGGAWLVNFIEGLAINDNPNLPCAVRLVRD
ncbi:MAG: DUF1566 domain-containing protein [Methylovulum sp.]|nr:DUF1566 domain-containing protein [Methylovulum sp.]